MDRLDFGVLGALEVDTDFNVNILTGASGRMMGGLGGGPDVAAGAAVSIVALPIVRGESRRWWSGWRPAARRERRWPA